MSELTVGSIIKQGFNLGIKNSASLLGAVILWLLTIWIPYINVGTTIGILSIVVAMSKGTMISPTEIFSAKYRKYMGEFFLLVAFLYIGTIIGFLFLIIPGLVISIAWGQSIYLLIDKELSPTEALKISNQITYGEKWTIFFGVILLSLILGLIMGALSLLGTQSSEALGAILSIVGVIIFYPIILGAYAHIYGELVKKIEHRV